MFICLFVCLWCCSVFCFNHHGTPTGRFPERFVKVQIDLAEIFRISKCLFICLFICFEEFFVLIIVGYPQDVSLKVYEDLTWFGWDIKDLKKCLIVCLFIDLFVFHFKHSGTPTGCYHENFLWIERDLAEILRI